MAAAKYGFPTASFMSLNIKELKEITIFQYNQLIVNHSTYPLSNCRLYRRLIPHVVCSEIITDRLLKKCIWPCKHHYYADLKADPSSFVSIGTT